MRLWGRVKVGSIEYSVYLATKEENPDLDGADAYTYWDKAEIHVLDIIAPERFAPALFHELFHAALEAGGGDYFLQTLLGKKWTAEAEDQLIRCVEGVFVGALQQTGWRPKLTKRTRKAKEPK
jgi:hypothetical protein